MPPRCGQSPISTPDRDCTPPTPPAVQAERGNNQGGGEGEAAEGDDHDATPAR